MFVNPLSKRGVSKKGVFSIGIVVAFIVSMLIVTLVVFVIISQTKVTEGKAFESYGFVREEVVIGSDVFYIDARDGTDGTLENITAFIRLSDTSGALRLDKTIIRVITMETEQTYSFGGIGRKNSGLGSNGSAYYAIEFLTKAERHSDEVLNVGEKAKIFFPLPSTVYEGERINIEFYPHNGRNDIKRITVPTTVVSERVQLYP